MAVLQQPGGTGRTSGRAAGRAGAAPEVLSGDLTRVLTTDAHDPGWVDAGPFRAHLRHLMSVGGLDAAEAAVVLGLPTRAVQHLLTGRAGRLPRRISPHTARRLLLVRAADVSGLRWSVTPTEAARAALARLRSHGWSTDEVATAVGFGVGELARLEADVRCCRLLAVRVVGLARRLPGAVDDEDLTRLPTAA